MHSENEAKGFLMVHHLLTANTWAVNEYFDNRLAYENL